jgi:uncharacterized membrane protein HdeD (DUF308 family)
MPRISFPWRSGDYSPRVGEDPSPAGGGRLSVYRNDSITRRTCAGDVEGPASTAATTGGITGGRDGRPNHAESRVNFVSDTAPQSRRTTVVALIPDWRVPLVAGILTFIAGIVVLVEPHGTLKAITVVVGIYLLLVGIVIGAAGLVSEPKKWAVFLLGVLAVLGGIFVMIHPGSTLHAVRIVLGIYLVIAGGLRLFASFGDSGNRVNDLLRGGIDLIAGLVLLFAPSLGLSALAVIVGIYLLISALMEFFIAWGLRDMENNPVV